MARRRKSNPRRKAAHRRRRNATRVVVMAPRHQRRRRSNPRRVSRRRYARRRNPSQVFGSALFSKGTLTMVGGGLLGVAAAKLLPTMAPASLNLTSSTLARVAATGVSAWLASFVAGKIPGMGGTFADAVFFGGLMQTGSVALNAILPGFQIGGVPVSLSGMGDLVSGQFAVPQNPIRSASLAAAAPAQARVQMNGLQRAYGVAF